MSCGSRPGQEIHLGPLAKSETRTAFQEGLLAVLADNRRPAEIIDFLSQDDRNALADKTEGFPRYITTAIRGVIRCIDSGSVQDQSFARIERTIARERDDFYQSRIPASFIASEFAPLAQVLASSTDGIHEGDLRQFVMDLRSRVAAEESFQAVWGKLLRSGLVTPIGAGCYGVGIPSMNEYILRVARRSGEPDLGCKAISDIVKRTLGCESAGVGA